MKIVNEGIMREIFHKKYILHAISKKKGKNSTINKCFDKHGNEVSMYENVKKGDEETITK